MRDDGKRRGVDGSTWRKRVTSASLACLASACGLAGTSVLGCDLLPKSKPDSNIELVVAKTTPSEGLNPRWTAEVRIHNHGDTICRLLSYELRWRGGSKVVPSDHTETIVANGYLIKTVHLGQASQALEGLSGDANCVVD